MKKTSIILAAVLIAGALQAATITQTHTIATHGPGNFDSQSVDTWAFNEFNTALGTLNSVRIIFSTQAWGGYIGTDNDGASGANGIVSFNVWDTLSSDKTLSDTGNKTAWTAQYLRKETAFTLAANEGDGAGYQEEGADWNSFSGPIEANADTKSADILIRSLYMSDYEGAGTFNMSATSYQIINASLGGATEGRSSSQFAKGSVQLIYNYTIPEPASASMAVLVLVAGFWIRRRFID